MDVVEDPWARVRDPQPIPAHLTSQDLAAMEDRDFSELLRTHLVPRENLPQGRQRWAALWDTLGGHEALTERAFDVLEEFLVRTETALEGGRLDDTAGRRARKFIVLCEDSWQRLQGVDADLPLAWLGRRARKFNPPARAVIDRLVRAVDEHRAAVSAQGGGTVEDKALWAVLRSLGLDPGGRDERLPDARP